MKPESNVGGLLGKSSRLLSNQFNTALKTYDLTVEQWSLLAVLWDKDVQKQKELQSVLIKDKATINSLVSYLVKNGFVSKKQDLKDKRSFRISLTQKGKEMQKLTLPVAKENIAIAIQGVDPQELKIMMKVLTQIIDNLTKEKS